MARVRLGLITSAISAGFLADARPVEVPTPWGAATFTVGRLGDELVAGLTRYGEQRQIPSHHINFRANLWGFRELGVERIISQNAIGSVNPMLQPGDVVISDDFIDQTKDRPRTFFDGGDAWVRVDLTTPFCPEVRRALVDATRAVFGRVQDGGTFVCAEGPRFETPAEIRMFHRWGGDIIGTPLVPEVVLAREAQICFASIAAIINYGAGLAPAVIQSGDGSMNAFYYGGDLHTNVERSIALAFARLGEARACGCGSALAGAFHGVMPDWAARPPAGLPEA